MRPRLSREIQCEKCPWRKGSDPYAIPNGYDVERHRALKETVADPGSIEGLGRGLRAMACHDSNVGREAFCIGWLENQMGPGNNIALRFRMKDYDLSRVRTVGPQHERFEDTLPKRRRKR